MRLRPRRAHPPALPVGQGRDHRRGPISHPAAAQRAVTSDPGPILVAISGDDHWAALEWSAAEAAARQVPLRIVHAFPLLPVLDGSGALPLAPAAHGIQEAARRALERALARAHEVAPDLPVTTHLVPGPTVLGVLSQKSNDALVVLGRPRMDRRWSWPPSRSTWRRLTRQNTTTPVMIVGLSAASSATGPSAGNVVVGVDLDHPTQAVLEFAFAAACRRGVGVTVLHSWTPSSHDGRSPEHEAAASAVHGQRLSAALEAHLTAFADVPVHQHLTTEAAPLALVKESAGAALVVVGVRPEVVGLLPLRRKIPDLVVLHVTAPVAIVPVYQQEREQPVPGQGITPARRDRPHNES